MEKSLEHLSKEELIDAYKRLQTSKDELQTSKDYLQFQYDQLRRLVFGTKRERFIAGNNPHQQSLPFFSRRSID